MKKVIVINGSGGVGKDTFIDLFTERMNFYGLKVDRFSSVDKVKELAMLAGWDGAKDEKSRKFLSDLKFLTSEFCDMPFLSMKQRYEYFCSSYNSVLFLHIREPKEIERACKEFSAISLLITNSNVPQIISNEADGNVFNYYYNFIIDNSGTLEELKKKAAEFADLLYLSQ